MIVALIGNQNSGKTTLFNQLTGSKQKVGNFPGVTVSKKEAALRGHKDFTVVDLPGIYSLSPYSTEELVTRDFLLDEKPDVILNIVDSTHIERSLYLTLQLMEMDIPLVLALNMMDEIKAKGSHIHVDMLSQELGIPVVPISASKNEGVATLIDEIVHTAVKKNKASHKDLCGGPAHRTIHAIMFFIEDHAEAAGIAPRFAATKICEKDEMIYQRLGLDQNEQEACEHMIAEMEADLGTDHLAALADMRYQFIDKLCAVAIHKGANDQDPLTVKLDRILAHKIWAIPIFLLSMLVIFYFAFSGPGAWLAKEFVAGIDWLTQQFDYALSVWNVHPVLHALLIDGILAGVGSVLSFLPLIIVLFLLLSLLEDSGYMARVAFVMDAFLRKIGLSGASIVPMIMGFGCTVPAIMATRTLPSARDRKMTIFLLPFMSCSAKVPIYAAITAIFFPRSAGLIMGGLYLLGILLAILAGTLLKSTAFKGEPIPFLMELPPYRFPSLKSVGRDLLEKIKGFMTRAFTVILLVSLVIWFLQSFDSGLRYTTEADHSLLAAISNFAAPLFTPLGFSSWKAPAALISGLTAKEAVISTLAVLNNSSVDGLSSSLQTMFTAPAALAFLVFTLIYTPCIAAVSAARIEVGSWSTALIMALIQSLLAWLIAAATYQLAKLWQLNTSLALAVSLLLIFLYVSVLYFNRQKQGKSEVKT